MFVVNKGDDGVHARVHNYIIYVIYIYIYIYASMPTQSGYWITLFKQLINERTMRTILHILYNIIHRV